MKMIEYFRGRFRSSGGYFLNQAVVSSGSFAMIIFLGRELGPEGFGFFSIGWMVVLFINSLQQAFLLTPMMSLFAGQGVSYLGTVGWLQLGMSMLTLLLGLGCLLIAEAVILDAEYQALILPVTVASLGHQFFDFNRKRLLVLQQLDRVQRFDLITLSLQFGLTGLLWVKGGLTPVTVFYPVAMAYFFPAVFPIWAASQKGSRESVVPTIRLHWGYGGWLGATALLQWLSGNFFLLVGATVLGPVALGAIRMAQSIMGFLNVFLLALENFVPVRSAQVLKEGGIQAIRHYLQKVSLKSGLFYFPVLGLIVLVAPSIVGLVFGSAYVPYAPVLRGFALVYCLVFLGTFLRFYYRTVGITREIFFGYVLSTLAGLSLANLFVSTWGIYGVLAGLVMCQLLICVWLWLRLPSSIIPIRI